VSEELINMTIQTNFEIGDIAVFDNGVDTPEKIKIEDFSYEWCNGEQILCAKYGRSCYDFTFLRKPTEEE
jgi:hypothetical protein